MCMNVCVSVFYEVPVSLNEKDNAQVLFTKWHCFILPTE